MRLPESSASKVRAFATTFAVACVSLLAACLVAVPGAALAGDLSPALERRMAELPPGADVNVLLVLREQAPVARLDAELHALHASRAERHRIVVDALRAAAARSQGPLLADVAARQSASSLRSFTAYWLVNAVAVTAPADVVRALASRTDVDAVEPRLALRPPDDVARLRSGDLPSDASIGITTGLLAIQARRVWTELGIDGTGALVANLDTGVDGTHPALAARWRGNFAPAAECWRDAAGFGDAVPVDRNAHGTHVMGTMCGLAPNDTIGVAPGARWIADNALNQGLGGAFDADILDAFQWFADPDGNSSTIDDVPDVVQNSWGVNELFGYLDCDSRWWMMIDHCEAAGVAVTWSAGGDGPGAGSVRSPADRASTPYSSFSIGTTTAVAPYPMATFSSRGPSGCGGPYAVKPEVAAPGVDTYSSVPGGGYQVWTGSSMSGAHAAGVVGLMRAADPDVEVDTIKQILMDTSHDLGAAGDDNAYGHGFVDAYAAVVAVLQGYGRVAGTVTDAVTGAAVAGTQVTVGGEARATTDASGFFDVPCAPGTWSIGYAADGYIGAPQAIVVAAHQIADGSSALVPEGSDVAASPASPRDFSLSLPRPSPSGAASSVEYSVPDDGAVVWISIVDVAGRQIRTLVRGRVGGGTHFASWDGGDAAGRRVTSGVYFYRMVAGYFSAARKVIVLE